MKPYEYARPNDLDEALALLSDTWGETEILAGGTDLITCMKQHVTEPSRLVSLRDIEALRGITVDDESVSIGAMTTLADVAAHAEVRTLYPAIVTAIEGIGAAQMVNAGTVGGDCCQRPRCWYFRTENGLLAQANGESLVPDGDNRYHAIFGNEAAAHFVSPSSLGPALIALGAEMFITGPGGATRTVPAGDFFKRPESEAERETVLAPNEILVAIRILKLGLKNATYEVRHRAGLDWPYATASVAFAYDDEKVSAARVVLGHVAPTPWSVPDAAAKLEGSAVTEKHAAACGEAAIGGATPLSKNGYKLQLARTAVKRALLAAAGSTKEA